MREAAQAEAQVVRRGVGDDCQNLAGPGSGRSALDVRSSVGPGVLADLQIPDTRAGPGTGPGDTRHCQKRGFQAAVAVVDRFGVVQVVLRDRYAGPHTPATATGKAWTAATFRSSTSSLFAISQPGMMQAGIRNLPGVVIIGGGLVVESGGALVGAVGVSGAPGGDADEACAKAGIDAVQGKLDF